MFQGRGFESQTYTGWTFFTYISCKNSNDVCLKRLKINDKKRPGLAHFFKKNSSCIPTDLSIQIRRPVDLLQTFNDEKIVK